MLNFRPNPRMQQTLFFFCCKSTEERGALQAMSGLPDEVIMDILLRLPAKSLVRFRCVCSSWNSLLVSAFFIEAYHHRCSESGNKYLLKYDSDNSSRVGIYDLGSRSLAALDPSFDANNGKFEIVGSSNGIVCLTTYKKKDYTQSEIVLWNPSTNERRRLPHPRFFVSEVVGFGFDSSSGSAGHLGDLKVVNIRIRYLHHIGRRSQMEVYSLRRGSWKRISNEFPHGIHPNCLGKQVVFKNFVCWSYNSDTLLILFDLVEEAFHRMVLPVTVGSVTEQICLLDGCLCLVVYNQSCFSREVWTMKELGVAEPWNKLYTLDLDVFSTPGVGLGYSPLGFAGSEAIFFIKKSSSDLHLVSYNMKTAQFEEFQVQVDSVESCRLVTYTESLVSFMNSGSNERDSVISHVSSYEHQ